MRAHAAGRRGHSDERVRGPDPLTPLTWWTSFDTESSRRPIGPRSRAAVRPRLLSLPWSSPTNMADANAAHLSRAHSPPRNTPRHGAWWMSGRPRKGTQVGGLRRHEADEKPGPDLVSACRDVARKVCSGRQFAARPARVNTGAVMLTRVDPLSGRTCQWGFDHHAPVEPPGGQPSAEPRAVKASPLPPSVRGSACECSCGVRPRAWAEPSALTSSATESRQRSSRSAG